MTAAVVLDQAIDTYFKAQHALAVATAATLSDDPEWLASFGESADFVQERRHRGVDRLHVVQNGAPSFIEISQPDADSGQRSGLVAGQLAADLVAAFRDLLAYLAHGLAPSVGPEGSVGRSSAQGSASSAEGHTPGGAQ